MANHVITFESVTFVDRTQDDMGIEMDGAEIERFVSDNPQFFGRDDGLVAIRQVYSTEDDAQGHDVKMFISIGLEIELEDDEDADDLEPIEDVLEALAHRLYGTDAMDLECWENTDSEPVSRPSPAMTA